MPGEPLSPAKFPGLEPFRVAGYAGSGVSPRPYTFTLPGYGVWIVSVFAWYSNQTYAIHQAGIITWWRYDASGAQAKTLGSSAMIGAPSPAKDDGSGNLNLLNSLTVSDPTASGAVTVTVGWSDASTLNPRVVVKAVRMQDVPGLRM